MKKFLLALMLAISIPCFATTYVAEHGKDLIILDDTALCPKETQELVLQRGARADLVLSMHGFTARINGQELHGCWVPVEGSVALVWSDGDIGQIPQSAFHKAKEA